ncbi:MAG TPA: anhydro-N-acetylmuramic acid kinase [Steroidobacteraceae bacterium]
MTLYIGLMSGTSVDGIDAVLLDVSSQGLKIRAAAQRSWPESIRQRLHQLIEHPGEMALDELGELDHAVGAEFAAAASHLLSAASLDSGQIRALGSHGQTVRHRPRGLTPFTMQIGDPNLIAERTGIDVIADFRRRDIAAGGEGAPLVPAFHAAAFGIPGRMQAVVNIGGIANVTLLAADGTVTGFDTGPGNCLLDGWARRHLGQPIDENGRWAASGRINAALLKALLSEPYFSLPPPKSTGRELFASAWLERALTSRAIEPADVQATLAELTARSIGAALLAGDRARQPDRVLVCGGGAYNPHLMNRLAAALPGIELGTTASCGIAPEHVEGAAFAYLAHCHLTGLAGNVPAVTGARHGVVLGARYPGKRPAGPSGTPAAG